MDDFASDDAGKLGPGGRWLVDPLLSRLKEHGAVVGFFEPDPAQYWWIDLVYRQVEFKLIVNHDFPYECVVSLLTRRGLIDRLVRRDHAKESEEVFALICDAVRADPRAGTVLTWKGPASVREEQRFVAEARKQLEGDSPLPGSTRVSRKPRG